MSKKKYFCALSSLKWSDLVKSNLSEVMTHKYLLFYSLPYSYVVVQFKWIVALYGSITDKTQYAGLDLNKKSFLLTIKTVIKNTV